MVTAPPITNVRRELVTHDGASDGTRAIPEETAIAFTYGSATFAVMMATPENLEDFAIGFSLTEGIIANRNEITSVEVIPHEHGIEARMTLAGERDEQLLSRRRRLAGPAGCGLCGIESLEAAVRPVPKVKSDLRTDAHAVFSAIGSLREHQRLNAVTKAVHAVGFWSATENRFVAVREDVGRHNALDKLAGALACARVDSSEGFIVLSSRLSIELVQKAATIGCPMLVAVSAPTNFALRAAEAAGMTLIAVAREDSFEIFTHPQRVITAVFDEAG
ncbi:MAG TPA: formate dehydrogenase accessory sulfurtransferase FdhD [Rhizomicrobium sp.]|jgi:FdhD protein|nr:formate dehydrogenase accessory sulfurtransferase FdhD [Rhizomicrobium sp.]